MSSQSTFVNGLIAGAGAVLALMSYGFLQFVAPLENVQGVTTIELRIAILLGGIVCAVAVGYEFYRKKEIKEQKDKSADTEIDEAKYRKLFDKLKKEEQKAESSDE